VENALNGEWAKTTDSPLQLVRGPRYSPRMLCPVWTSTLICQSDSARYRCPRHFSNSSLHFFCTGPLLPQAKKSSAFKKRTGATRLWKSAMTIINHVCLTIEPGKGQSIPSFNPRNIPGSERNRVTTTLRATSGRLAWLKGMEKITPALYTIAPGVAHPIWNGFLPFCPQI
jgi:hypothetical protein